MPIMTRTKNKKSTLRSKISNAHSIFSELEDDSSESSGKGREFLKAKTNKPQRKIKKPAQSCSEDELTDDLLVPYTAVPDRRTQQLKRSSLKNSERLATPQTEKRVTIMEDLKTKNNSSQRTGLVSSVSESGAISTLDNTFIFQEDGDGALGQLSLLSIADGEESTKEVRSQLVLTEDVVSNGNILLSVDELTEPASQRKPPSSKLGLSSAKECTEIGSLRQIQESPSSVSEIEEFLEVNSTSTRKTTRSKRSADSQKSEAYSYSDDFPEELSSAEPSEISESLDDQNESASVPAQSIDEYCDDFESENEQPGPVTKDDMNEHQKINEIKSKPVSGQKAKSKKERSLVATTDKRSARKLVPDDSESHSRTSRHVKDLRHSSYKVTHHSVEVQTSWTGDFLTATPMSVPIQPQLWNVPQNFPPMIQYTAPEPFPIVDGKALDAISTYNPCLRALDNILRQQLHITREFMSSQQQLHRALSKTISRCLTTDYPTWRNTIQLLTSAPPR